MDNFPQLRKENESEVVSARELYDFLGVQAQFTDWCKRMFEYGFEENKDFNLHKFEEVRKEGNRMVKREIVDYVLTIDTAKEISMLQRSEKGKAARQYFIECEKALRKDTISIANIGMKEMALMIIRQEDEKERLLSENQQLQKVEKYHAPMVEAYHTLMDSGQSLNMEESAKNMGLKSRQVLINKLKQMGLLTSNNRPTSDMIEKGFMTLKQTLIKNGKETYLQTFLTQKGIQYVAKRLGLISDSTELIKL